ncbi:Uncharacterised protein [Halioglobus japonicus]|jgi:hypothetical protein|nr:Uncharacterised protein [Halioglobus japonicus]
MSKILGSMFTSLVTGLCFALGALGGLLIYNDRTGQAPREIVHSESPPGIELIDHSIKTATNLTIVGSVLNKSEYIWDSVGIHAIIYVGDWQVGRCYEYIKNFEVGGPRRFRIECREVGGANLPENVRYELTIVQAHRQKST